VASEILFEIKTPLNVTVRTTKEYWEYVVNIKHREMNTKKETVKAALSEPDTIRKSKIDEGVEGFLITAYPTDKVKEGEIIWTK
jgi:hypothetical protein